MPSTASDLPVAHTFTYYAPSASALEPDGRRWLRVLAAYREPSLARSVIELLVTGVSFACLWLAQHQYEARLLGTGRGLERA
jgi:hypothetical protein